jgi:arylsulfatase A-like enzyme
MSWTAVLGLALSVQAETPNIVLLYVDDLGYGDLGCYGATAVETPHVDRLAGEGLRFTDAHCPAATCTPSRYSLLTGRYAFRRGAEILDGNAPLLITPGTPTLPGMLKENGYATAVIGKWHLGLGDGTVDWNGAVAPGPLEIGFDFSYIIPATGDRVPCVMLKNHHVEGLDPDDPIQVSYGKRIGDGPTGKERPDLLRQQADDQHTETIINGISRIGYMSGGHAARWRDETVPYQMLREARGFIRANRDRPFFLYFAFHDIHDPNLPDHPFVGATGMGPRGDAIVQMDWFTGQLVHFLEQQGLKENTLIIFSSDNGPVVTDGYEDHGLELLGDHRPAGPFRGGKYSAYEAGTRVPHIVVWPGTIRPGISDALVGHVDLYASIARLIGHPLGDGEAPDSLDTLDVFLGRSQGGREFLLEEAFTLALRTQTAKYIQPVQKQGHAWIQANKNIASGLSTEPQLFDVEKDPGETRNLAASRPETLAMMEAELRRIVDHPQPGRKVQTGQGSRP